MYKIELSININAKNKYFTEWLRLNYSVNFIGTSEGTTINIYFESEPDETEKTEIINFYNAITEEDSSDPLGDELLQKESRKEYGLILSSLVSSKFRLLRLSLDASLSSHEQERDLTYVHFDTLKLSIESGNFINAYEDVSNLTTEMGLTETEIDEYRFMISIYLVSLDGLYVDPLGNKVEGGKYNELKGKSIDLNGFIIE